MALDVLQTEYTGRKGPMFRLALVSAILTVLTLGLYRFWMKTRLRRYYWSAIRPGGLPLEYVGEPMEKLLGFLTAVVVMAFYIGIVNLVLMFFSFSLFKGNGAAYGLSFLGVLPIIFFAQYRARRYVLARSRWRGIRFGLEPGAWGYAWRAAVHWLITLCTLGVLWPRMTFWLEKYRTDHTFFGTERFEQGGRWSLLLGAMKHVYLGIAFAGGSLFWLVAGEAPVAILAFIGALGWLGYGLAHWRAHSFRILTVNKSLGGAGFTSAPRPWRVLRIYMLGFGAAYLCAALGAGLAVGVLAAVVGVERLAAVADIANGADMAGALPVWAVAIAGFVIYFAVFVFWGVLVQVFVKLPLARHFAETTAITGALSLNHIGQRDRDEFEEAEGFADALDVGAAL